MSTEQAPAQNETPQIAVPGNLWSTISTYIGSQPWHTVRQLRYAVANVLTAAGVTAEVPTVPAQVIVELQLFNATVAFMGQRPCDEVDGIMRQIEGFVEQIKSQQAAAQAAQNELMAKIEATAALPPVMAATAND